MLPRLWYDPAAGAADFRVPPRAFDVIHQMAETAAPTTTAVVHTDTATAPAMSRPTVLEESRPAGSGEGVGVLEGVEDCVELVDCVSDGDTAATSAAISVGT